MDTIHTRYQFNSFIPPASSFGELKNNLTHIYRRGRCGQIFSSPPFCRFIFSYVGHQLTILKVSNEFQANKEPTIGAAFLTQKCRLEDRVLRYEIWDTAGQERFHSLAVSPTTTLPHTHSDSDVQPMYYRNAQAAVVVYDVTKATSLEKAKSWVKELQRQANPNIVIALAGNKVDLVQTSPSSSGSSPSPESEDEADDATATPGGTPSASGGEPESLRQVPREEAQAYATEAGLLFFETSAKTGEGIVEIFTEIGMPLALNVELLLKITSSEENTYRAYSGFVARWRR